MLAIETFNLTKEYRAGFWRARRRRALDQLCLRIEPGETFGLLGPNGAGKSTTLKLLFRLIFPTSGSARILGCEPGDLALRRRIGYLPENPTFYDHLSATEFLEFVAQIFGMTHREGRLRAAALIERTGLADAGKLPIRKFSKGMVQRLGIAQCLMNDPELIFFDEPMSGLDPVGRREVRNLILELRAAGKTVFFSTHILSDAESLCDRVAVLDRGRLLGCGELHEVLAMETPASEMVLEDPPEELLGELAKHARACVRAGNQVRLEFSSEEDPARMLGNALARGVRVISFNPVKASLEDYFMAQLDAAAPPPSDTARTEPIYDPSHRHNRPAHV